MIGQSQKNVIDLLALPKSDNYSHSFGVTYIDYKTKVELRAKEMGSSVVLLGTHWEPVGNFGKSNWEHNK